MLTLVFGSRDRFSPLALGLLAPEASYCLTHGPMASSLLIGHLQPTICKANETLKDAVVIA